MSPVRRLRFPVLGLAFGWASWACSDSSTGPDGGGGPVEDGTLQIVVSTTGNLKDTDGYSATVAGQTISLSPDDDQTVSLAPGSYGVALSGVAPNCVPDVTPEVTTTVTSNVRSVVTFAMTCFEDPLLFTRRAGDRSEIWVAEAEGGFEALLTDDDALYYAFLAPGALSPDRTRVVFQSAAEDTFDYDVYVMPLNKSELYQHRAAGTQSRPSWSPDGASVVFAGTGLAESGDIWVADDDLSNVRAIVATDDDWESFPSWSADGSQVVFVVEPIGAEPIPGGISIVDADGSNRTELTAPASGKMDREPALSPDGTQVLFLRQSFGDDPAQEVWVVPSDGSSAASVIAAEGAWAENALWSPDGASIFFGACPEQICTVRDVWSVPAAGGAPTRITNEGDEFPMAWNATRTFAGAVDPGVALLTAKVDDLNPASLFRMAPDGTGRSLVAEGLEPYPVVVWR